MTNQNSIETFRKFCANRVVVIWGLRTFRHTHSYIHANYHNMLKRHDIGVVWLDDDLKNQKSVPMNAVLICVGFASRHVPLRSDITYLAHNMNGEQKLRFEELEVLFYENYKLDSLGYPHKDADIALWNPDTRLLAQPYGTPVPEQNWANFKDCPTSSPYENWVGSIWNDRFNRGNEEVISCYIQALSRLHVTFRQIEFGRFAKLPISTRWERELISKSQFGGSIHSYYQVSEANIVCRFFKSISFGKLPITNQVHVERVFPGSSVVNSDLNILLENRLALPRSKATLQFKVAQQYLRSYTYEAAFSRMALALMGDWSVK